MCISSYDVVQHQCLCSDGSCLELLALAEVLQSLYRC